MRRAACCAHLPNWKTIEKGHGRLEQRTIWATEDVSWFAERKRWKNLRNLIRVRRERTVAGETSSEYHYYISSLSSKEPEKLPSYIRGHWSVENRLHWSLDVSFGDDGRRTRTGYGAENASRLARIAFNLLKAEKTLKARTKSKRLYCGWDHPYLLKVLTGPPRENLDAYALRKGRIAVALSLPAWYIAQFTCTGALPAPVDFCRRPEDGTS